MSQHAEAQDNACTYAVMRYASEKDAVGRQNTGTWQQVVALLRKRDVRPEKSGKAFAPVRMKAGTTRAKDHVLTISMAVADIDTEGEKDKATGRVLSVLKHAPPRWMRCAPPPRTIHGSPILPTGMSRDGMSTNIGSCFPWPAPARPKSGRRSGQG